jgi:hypothetical protein
MLLTRLQALPVIEMQLHFQKINNQGLNVDFSD